MANFSTATTGTGATADDPPGEEDNWMTASQALLRSERSETWHGMVKIFGIQSWVALPESQEETVPTFAHHAAETLPVIEGEGKVAADCGFAVWRTLAGGNALGDVLR